MGEREGCEVENSDVVQAQSSIAPGTRQNNHRHTTVNMCNIHTCILPYGLRQGYGTTSCERLRLRRRASIGSNKSVELIQTRSCACAGKRRSTVHVKFRNCLWSIIALLLLLASRPIPPLSSSIMAAPAEVTTRDLSGTYSMVRTIFQMFSYVLIYWFWTLRIRRLVTVSSFTYPYISQRSQRCFHSQTPTRFFVCRASAGSSESSSDLSL